MERNFKRAILYLFSLFFSLFLIFYNLIKNNGREILPIFLGVLLGIFSFEITYHLVNSLTGGVKKIKLKIAVFFIIFLLICIFIIFFSKSIIYTIFGFSSFVVSLLIMVFKEILNA